MQVISSRLGSQLPSEWLSKHMKAYSTAFLCFFFLKGGEKKNAYGALLSEFYLLIKPFSFSPFYFLNFFRPRFLFHFLPILFLPYLLSSLTFPLPPFPLPLAFPFSSIPPTFFLPYSLSPPFSYSSYPCISLSPNLLLSSYPILRFLSPPPSFYFLFLFFLSILFLFQLDIMRILHTSRLE